VLHMCCCRVASLICTSVVPTWAFLRSCTPGLGEPTPMLTWPVAWTSLLRLPFASSGNRPLLTPSTRRSLPGWREPSVCSTLQMCALIPVQDHTGGKRPAGWGGGFAIVIVQGLGAVAHGFYCFVCRQHFCIEKRQSFHDLCFHVCRLGMSESQP
jgi:hypothetical protein